LIDMEGRVVHQWSSDVTPGQSVYLLTNGNLVRPAQVGKENPSGMGGGGQAGRLQEYSWDNELLFDYKFANQTQLSHHDVCRLNNGNYFVIIWEKKSKEDAMAAGRTEATANMVQADCILEVKPTSKTTCEVVWEWHAWDHLVQDVDKNKTNYGDVAAHPELIDINFGSGLGANAGAKSAPADWTHVNSVILNYDTDQIMLSVHNLSEIWIIDHSTTKAEAAGHTGGRWGKGGDLLYRWGNPQAYRAGTKADQQLFVQHNAHWIPKGLPCEGHVMMFNNGGNRPGGTYSTVDEFVLPIAKDGSFIRPEPGKPYGPEKPLWTYAAPNKTDFYASNISGAQRLPNGNTLICMGTGGVFFEVTPDKEIVWNYVNGERGGKGAGKGGPPGGFDPKGDKGPPPDGIDPKGGKGPPPGGKGGPGGLGGGSVFRATRIAPDYPAFKGKDLSPGKTIEELYANDGKKG